MTASGRAIAVLGTGVDVCYPKENKKLYEKVL
jgi:predicted Rossmann fold nucleotide-binding protein DprA/Smf involved in DNA uptake